MTYPHNPRQRLPRGDKNRRLSLGASREEMAAAVGITPEELRQYEFTQPDRGFSPTLAGRIGAALEASRIPLVSNGPVPRDVYD